MRRSAVFSNAFLGRRGPERRAQTLRVRGPKEAGNAAASCGIKIARIVTREKVAGEWQSIHAYAPRGWRDATAPVSHALRRAVCAGFPLEKHS